jgi:HAD superfamily hydrolase (TIGR01450 family)
MNNIKAIILAAGIGSRLYPITEKMPKSLIRVSGREILDYQIAGYIKAGILEEQIYVVTGYMSEMIEVFLSNKYPRVHIIVSNDYLTTNNMYSLYLALTKISNNAFLDFETLFINNADCLYDEALIQEFALCEYKNAIACKIGTYIDESMKIATNDNNIIIDIAKTINPENAAGVSVDLYKYSSEAIRKLYLILKDYIEVKKDIKQWTEVAFPILFKGIDVYPFDIKKRKWIEVDTMDDLLQADITFCTFEMANKKAVICDLDGTLYIGNKPIESAIEFVYRNRYRYDFYFLTNNTSCPPKEYIKKLATYKLDVLEDEICTPFIPLIRYIKNKHYKSIYLVATDAVVEYLCVQLPEIDFSYDYDNNEAIVLTYDKEITYQKLKNMALLLNNKRSIDYICTHSDIFCPTEFGNIPDIGSMIEMLYMTTGKRPSIIFGKPNTELIETIINKYGNEKIAIAGDRLYTDGVLAKNSGIDFICVLSGESTRVDVAFCNYQNNILVIQDLGCLLHNNRTSECEIIYLSRTDEISTTKIKQTYGNYPPPPPPGN